MAHTFQKVPRVDKARTLKQAKVQHYQAAQAEKVSYYNPCTRRQCYILEVVLLLTVLSSITDIRTQKLRKQQAIY